VSDGHHKHHHGHETTDAYAEGWEARERALNNETVKNPYRAEVEIIATKHTKRSMRQIEARMHDVELWDSGWNDRDEAIRDEKQGKI
jgi:hypothetical protein